MAAVIRNWENYLVLPVVPTVVRQQIQEELGVLEVVVEVVHGRRKRHQTGRNLDLVYRAVTQDDVGSGIVYSVEIA